MVPLAEAEIVDDWQVLGLLGTGSKSLVLRDVFPEHRSVMVSDLFAGTPPGALVHPDYPVLRAPRGFLVSYSLPPVDPPWQLPCILMSAYTSQVSRRVYRTLCRKAADALAAGYSVIIDAVSLKPEERRSFLEVGATAGVPFVGLWLAAPGTTMDRRLRERRHDASDASPEVLAQQVQQDPGAMDWFASMRALVRRMPERWAPRSRVRLIAGAGSD